MQPNDGEAQTWQLLINDLDNPITPMEPVRIRVDHELETIGDVLHFVEQNIRNRRLSPEAEQRAHDFCTALLVDTDEPKGIITALPYEETPDGLEVILSFPNRDNPHGQA